MVALTTTGFTVALPWDQKHEAKRKAHQLGTGNQRAEQSSGRIAHDVRQTRIALRDVVLQKLDLEAE